MAGQIAHQVTEDGVLVVLRPSVGAPSSIRVTEEEVARFARAILDELGLGDGLGPCGGVLSVGRLNVDTGAKDVFIDGQWLRLTNKEYGIFEALAKRRGTTLSKEALLSYLYQGRDEPELKIIDVFICKARHKLRRFGAEALLETVWGRGYRLVAEPSPDVRERPAYQPYGIQGAVLARLERGPAKFLDLWTACPEAGQNSVRNAILALRHRGAITSSGDPRAAVYSLIQRAAA